MRSPTISPGSVIPTTRRTFERYWPAELHLVGKEIIRFHCLYWPALLLSAGLPLPKQVFAHGWLTKDGQKISKTTGNTVDPSALADEFGSDAVRYYLLRSTPFGQDGDYTRQSFLRLYNAELANAFGNLVQRATALASRNASALSVEGVAGRTRATPVRAGRPPRVARDDGLRDAGVARGGDGRGRLRHRSQSLPAGDDAVGPGQDG